MNYSKKEESIFQRFYRRFDTLSDFFELEAVAKPLTDYESLNRVAQGVFHWYYGALDWFEANFTINPQKVNAFTLIKNAAAN